MPRMRALEDRLGKFEWSGPSLEQLGIRVLPGGEVDVYQSYYRAPGVLMRGKSRFATVNEALRGLIHAQESETAALRNTRETYAKLRGLHSRLELLGRNAAPEARQPLMNEMASLLSALSLKKRPLKVAATGQLVDHEAREKLRKGAIELLRKGNWPAAQAAMAKMFEQLKEDNRQVYGEVLPVLRLRERALRAYLSNHLFYAQGALERVQKYTQPNAPITADVFARDISEALYRVGGLTYYKSRQAVTHLSAARKLAEKGDFRSAIHGLRHAETHLERTIARLRETGGP